MIEESHRLAPLLFALQRLGSRVMHRAIDVHARKTLISVFNDARILFITAAISRNLFYVQSHCALAATFS